MQFKIGSWSTYTLVSFTVYFGLLFSSHAFAEQHISKEHLTFSVFEYPPFLMERSDDYGLEPAIVRQAYEQMGGTVSFVFVPPARAIEMAKLGLVDGTVGWVHSDERAANFYFSETIARAPLVFFHIKQKAFSWNNYAELQGKTIGTVNQYYYGSDFQKALQSGHFQIESVSDDRLNLKKLVAGRIDLTPVNLYVGYYLAKELFDAEAAKLITHNARQLKVSEHHLLLPKVLPQSQSRLALFNEGLFALKKSDEYQAILQRYKPEEELFQKASLTLGSLATKHTER